METNTHQHRALGLAMLRPSAVAWKDKQAGNGCVECEPEADVAAAYLAVRLDVQNQGWDHADRFLSADVALPTHTTYHCLYTQ